ncbi:MAG: hypothetical protein AAB489_00410 [Patescibacteria group bacterium]
MTISEALRASSPTTLDAEFLLVRVVQKNRAVLLAHGKTPLAEEQKKH